MEISECVISNRPCLLVEIGYCWERKKKIENTLSYVFENYELSNLAKLITALHDNDGIKFK
jgi:hypothetical protein